MTVRFFQIFAVVLAAIAFYSYLQNNIDYMFGAAVLGAVSFFLSIRFQVKGRLTARELERQAAEQEDQ